MNRRFRTIAAAVLLLGVASLVGGCKKCECENGNGGGGSNSSSNISGTIAVNNNCVQFIDNWISKGNSYEHKMQVKLSCVSDSDTSYLEFDGTRIKEFYGHDDVEVTKNVENGSHRILCYTVGTNDTVVNVTFEQNNNGVTTHINL